MDQFSLEGRLAIVTGGSRGIGYAIAQEFLAEGHRVAVTARSGEGPKGGAFGKPNDRRDERPAQQGRFGGRPGGGHAPQQQPPQQKFSNNPFERLLKR